MKDHFIGCDMLLAQAGKGGIPGICISNCERRLHQRRTAPTSPSTASGCSRLLCQEFIQEAREG
eukprot:scaffold7385_cov533-Prasinococcus_capsulatus_cf.AAC.1